MPTFQIIGKKVLYFEHFITAETEEDALDSVLEEVEDSVEYNDIEYEITEV